MKRGKKDRWGAQERRGFSLFRLTFFSPKILKEGKVIAGQGIVGL
jgi:hypothetical protein